MNINTNIITSLGPCYDRLKNWIKYYKTFNGTVEQFLDLEHITHRDKLWVVLRLVSSDLLIMFAIDCAINAADAAFASDVIFDSADAIYDAVEAYAAYIAAAIYNTTACAADAIYDAAGAYAAEASYNAAACAAAGDACADDAYAAAYAAYAAAGAAYAAGVGVVNVAARQNEQQRQIESLIYLIQSENL
jgi:hypothetical protein